MKKISLLLFIFFLFIFSSLSINTQAASLTNTSLNKENINNSQFQHLAWDIPNRTTNWGLNTTALKTGLSSGQKTAPFSVLIGKIIKAVSGILGAIFILLMFYAGVLWMTAAGSDEQIGRAKKIIKTTVIGLVIVVFAYFIADFIVEILINSQNPPPEPTPTP